MADALCGPSNALSSFQKHTTVDRTLQQDRIASRPQFAQGFRSSSGPNAGILDAEFEAFRAGPLDNGFHEPQSFQPAPLSDQRAPATIPVGAPSWAADFQSMHSSEVRASPVPQSQFRSEAPMQHTTSARWHQDFMRQQSPSAVHQVHQQQWSDASHGYLGFTSYNTLMPASMHSTTTQQKQPARQQIEGELDQEAMERAFEAVSIEQIQSIEVQPATVDMANEFGEMYPYEEIRIGSDRILDERMETEEGNNNKNNADELARTAGQLLDNIKHDQSPKFQQSSFLALMRQLRDREVHVEGDKLVDSPQPLHPGGQFYPDGDPESAKDHSEEGFSSIKLGMRSDRMRAFGGEGAWA